MRISLNDDEQEVMYGQPHISIALYFILHRYMDFATGIVGVRTRVSWHAFTEWLCVEPRQGFPGERFSRDQVRRAAWHLERVGLIEMRSNERQRQLIFFLPLATRHSLVQKKAARTPPDMADTKPARPWPRENASKAATKAARPETPKAATHPVLSSKSTTTPCVVHSTAPDGAETAREGHLTAPDGAEWTSALIYPARLTTKERQFCSKAVSAIDQLDAQTLLDEFAGALQTAEVRSRTAYFRAIVKRHHEGTFTPEKALTVREQRQQAAEREADLSRHEAPAINPTGRRFGRGDLKALIEKGRVANGAA